MSTWMKNSWFTDLVSRIREAIGDALSLIENPACRLRTDMLLRCCNLHKQPETLSGMELVTELAKVMTRDRLRGQELAVYEEIYACLPPFRRVRDALSSSALHQHVKIPP